MVFSFKNCLYSSLGLHAAILVFFSLITNNKGIKKPFIVFGAYSKKNYHTKYNNGQIKHNHVKDTSCVSGNIKSKHTGHNGISNSSIHSSHSGQPNGTKKGTCSSIRKLKREKSKSNTLKNIVQRQRQKQSNLQLAKQLTRSKNIKIKAALNKKNELIAAQVKKQKEIALAAEMESAQKRELLSIIKEEKQLEELKKIDKDVKKDIEQKLSLQKVNKEIERAVNEAKKFEDESNATKCVDKKNYAQNAENEKLTLDATESEDSSEGLLDGNETTSNFVFNLNEQTSSEMGFYQKCIQQEVARLWKPPLGVPRSTTCRISFIVDKKGCIKDFEISKRSKILIYDLSILRVAHLFKFNKKLWGKSFAVDFCQ